MIASSYFKIVIALYAFYRDSNKSIKKKLARY